VRRWDLVFVPRLAGSDSEMVACEGGDWVAYDDHAAEVRQTQRRMIAALYWRAGVHRAQARVAYLAGHDEAAWILREHATCAQYTAELMEAAS